MALLIVLKFSKLLLHFMQVISDVGSVTFAGQIHGQLIVFSFEGRQPIEEALALAQILLQLLKPLLNMAVSPNLRLNGGEFGRIELEFQNLRSNADEALSFYLSE